MCGTQVVGFGTVGTRLCHGWMLHRAGEPCFFALSRHQQLPLLRFIPLFLKE